MVSKSDVQWAAQFLVAAELARRSYAVSFTMGNATPVADLMVGTSAGDQFWVDVKGKGPSQTNDWDLKPKLPRLNLFYILVSLGKGGRTDDRFFVLTQAEANALEKCYRLSRPTQTTTRPGFRFREALPHENRWDKILPSN